MSSSYAASSAPIAPSMDTYRPTPPSRSDIRDDAPGEPLLPPPVPERGDRSASGEQVPFTASTITDAVEAGLRRVKIKRKRKK